MFSPGEIVYGFVKHIGKSKYAICIYRDEDLNILLHFTTSQARAGVDSDEVRHGAIYKEGECLSYVFEAGHDIGENPSTGVSFHFPLRTTMAFDYGYLKAGTQQLFSLFEDPKVVCKLDDKEYIDLIYAMYRSKRTPLEYKPYLDAILSDYYQNH